MYIDLVVFIILLLLVVMFFKRFSSFVYFVAIFDIGLRILTFIRLNIGLPDVAALIGKYVPESILAIFAKYTDGTVYTILAWAFVIIMIIFESYIIKFFIKKKKVQVIEMRKNSNTWLKVVIAIVILELVVGGVIFAYKKINETPDNELSTQDDLVQSLYQKIAYEDLDNIDIMNPEVMLYYGYHNIEEGKEQTINCDVVQVEEDTTGYQCNGITTFIPEADLIDAVQSVYGPNVTVNLTDFQIDQQQHGFVDTTNKGIVVFQKSEEVMADTYNLRLVTAEQQDNKIILTTEVLDGIYGTVKASYKYTFEQNGDQYYLVQKETVAI